jgi:sugar/nucleoside kinase (ribokinase family)
VAAVTAGVEGAYFQTGEGSFHQGAFKVDVVDTTGAGDAFHGGYAYAMLRGWPVRQSAEFAAAVAAIKCTKLGGRTGLPTLAQVQEFIRASKRTGA